MKSQVLRLIRKFGYEIAKTETTAKYANPNGYKYSSIRTSSRYSPWLSDKKFLEAYNIIKPHTLVDIYRCYELWQLVEQVEKTGLKGDYLEVGAWQGGTSGIILSQLAVLNSTSTLFIADTFEGVVKTGPNDNFYAGGEHADTSETIVRNLLEQKLKVTNYRLLKGIFPEATAHLISAGTRFKFCHIDVDVYQGGKEIFEWVYPKLMTGGIVVFDDYGFESTSGVTAFVEEIRTMKGIIALYNLNGHGVIIKTQE